LISFSYYISPSAAIIIFDYYWFSIDWLFHWLLAASHAIDITLFFASARRFSAFAPLCALRYYWFRHIIIEGRIISSFFIFDIFIEFSFLHYWHFSDISSSTLLLILPLLYFTAFDYFSLLFHFIIFDIIDYYCISFILFSFQPFSFSPHSAAFHFIFFDITPIFLSLFRHYFRIFSLHFLQLSDIIAAFRHYWYFDIITLHILFSYFIFIFISQYFLSHYYEALYLGLLISFEISYFHEADIDYFSFLRCIGWSWYYWYWAIFILHITPLD
jgi:hypothetical protein